MTRGTGRGEQVRLVPLLCHKGVASRGFRLRGCQQASTLLPGLQAMERIVDSLMRVLHNPDGSKLEVPQGEVMRGPARPSMFLSHFSARPSPPDVRGLAIAAGKSQPPHSARAEYLRCGPHQCRVWFLARVTALVVSIPFITGNPQGHCPARGSEVVAAVPRRRHRGDPADARALQVQHRPAGELAPGLE